jgi:hypothetical protein
MDTKTITNNQRLRDLVANAGLTQLEAHALFNAGLDGFGYSFQYWKGFFSDPSTKRYKPFKDDQLTRAEKIFGKLAKTVD